jgi:hypothetical protein
MWDPSEVSTIAHQIRISEAYLLVLLLESSKHRRVAYKKRFGEGA